jgi:3-oxoadipate enol-lactonase
VVFGLSLEKYFFKDHMSELSLSTPITTKPLILSSAKGYQLNGIQQECVGADPSVTTIYLHGATSSIHLDDTLEFPLWSTLPSHNNNIRLIRYDALGHGQSAKVSIPEAYTWQSLSTDMTGIYLNNRSARTIIGGASMGAATALWSAFLAPENQRPDGLLLVIPPSAWEKRAKKAPDYAKLGLTARDSGMDKVISLLKRAPSTPFTARTYPEASELSLQELATFSADTYSALMTGAALSDLPLREELKGFPIPCLILARIEDPTHPLSVAEQLLALLPNARLSVASSFEDVQLWPAIVADWVEKLFRNRSTL